MRTNWFLLTDSFDTRFRMRCGEVFEVVIVYWISPRAEQKVRELNEEEARKHAAEGEPKEKKDHHDHAVEVGGLWQLCLWQLCRVTRELENRDSDQSPCDMHRYGVFEKHETL